MKSKWILSVSILALVATSLTMLPQQAAAQALSLSDVVRDTDGSVMLMSQIVADEYCQMQGLRLPTVRELAIYAQILGGARGTRETAYPHEPVTSPLVKAEIDKMRADGYTAMIEAAYQGQIVVSFYFNPTGYRTPAGDKGSNSLWAATLNPRTSSEAFEFSLGDATFGSYDRMHDPFAVSCVQAP